jgi:Zn finger protein HypA/HybF involved in hydrogenase expression
MIFGCPGSQKFKQPEPQIVNCPSCGREEKAVSTGADTLNSVPDTKC